MKRNAIIWSLTMGLMPGLTALAGEANSSASASSNRRGPGTAVATAGYEGNGIGFSQTNTRSGSTNLAQGLSLGFDEEGLSLSTSYAVAPRFGAAVAGTLNLAIGRDGSVATSVGRTVADGDPNRSVDAGGSARPGSLGRTPVAVASTGGATGPRGTVVSQTQSDSRPAGVRTPIVVSSGPRASAAPLVSNRMSGGSAAGQPLAQAPVTHRTVEHEKIRHVVRRAIVVR